MARYAPPLRGITHKGGNFPGGMPSAQLPSLALDSVFGSPNHRLRTKGLATRLGSEHGGAEIPQTVTTQTRGSGR